MMDESTPRKRTPLAPLQHSSYLPEKDTDVQGSPSKGSLAHKLIRPNAFCLTPFEIKEFRRKRAKEFGLTPPPLDSFLLNQSLPSAHQDPEDGNVGLAMGDIRRCTIDKFSGDALDSISYSPTKATHEFDTSRGRHLNGSFFHKSIDENSDISSQHTYAQNPRKAVVTIDALTLEILTTNKVAFFLLGLQDKYSSTKLNDYLIPSDDKCLFSDVELKTNGELVLVSGKVMDLITPGDVIIPVSVWARKLYSDVDIRCLVVMEPVERNTGTVKFGSTGTIIKCDSGFASIYGYSNPDDLTDKNIKDLMPTLEYSQESLNRNSKGGTKQCVTGRTIDDFTFPLSIQITPCSFDVESEGDSVEGAESTCYEGVVWVFNNISGLITLLPDGTIHSCNTNFSLNLFGYSQSELVGKNISMLIPEFLEDGFLDTDSMALPPFDDDDDSNAKCGTSDGRTTADSMGHDFPRPMNPLGKPLDDEYMQSTAFCSSYTDESSPSALSDKLENLPETDQLENFREATCSNALKLEELSASSSQYGSSSKHLSYSESQDTLHSCTNSITESDVNANFFGGPPEVQECHKDSASSKISVFAEEGNNDEKEDKGGDEKEDDDLNYEYGSDVYDSDSSADSEQSDYEECVNSDLAKSCSPCVDEVYFMRKTPASPVLNNLGIASSRVSPCENISDVLRMREMSPSECGLSSNALSPKVSTPNIKALSDSSFQSIPEGDFRGFGVHKDGTNIEIELSVKKVTLDDGKCLYCLWVSQDPENYKSCPPVSRGRFSNSHSEVSRTSQTQSERSLTETSGSSETSLLADDEYISGEFSQNYTILQHLRKGAFGCIKKAYRNSDGLLVITKFLRKSEVYKESWVMDKQLNQKVPLELSLLITLEHPNIVKVVDVFQNDLCFQLVMEKHGYGMDLFEFIERDPKLDEPLACYIFKQIVSALSYLHGLRVLHRDIKDENVIINEKFHIKLIDFGSATFIGNELFSTFCGTMEYCSPEVIRGNKYRGPELEMFSLGVTLYTLIFGENPFIGAEEILKGEYKIPSKISADLLNLISRLLEPDPIKRCTLPEVEMHPWLNQIVPIGRYEFSKVIRASAEEICPPKYFNVQSLESESGNSTESDVSFQERAVDDLDLSKLCLDKQ